MKSELNIALIQSNLVWENPEQNRIEFTNKINAISDPVDLIVLPEMFTSGFTMHPNHVAESMNGDTVLWMQKLAGLKKAAITGSLVIKENEKFYNRLLFVLPTGKIEYYDKKHTFTLAGEHKAYTAGSKVVIVDYLGWKICPLVCYDLRFPVWARNTNYYDVLLYVANWPKVRIAAWDTLLKARAIENMAYCIGVNRVGIDANNHEYSGHSGAYDFLGKRLDTMPIGLEATQLITLTKAHLVKNRKKLGFLEDRDEFSLKG